MLEHAFRKRFETILKLNNDIPIAVAEKLIGHKTYFDDRENTIQLDDNYVIPEINQLFEYFKLAVPKLTIDDSTRKQFALDKVTKEKSVLEQTNNILNETVKEKDELAKKLREALTNPIDENAINKKIDEILKKRKDL